VLRLTDRLLDVADELREARDTLAMFMQPTLPEGQRGTDPNGGPDRAA
jgi:hypothetical protein